MERKNKAMIEDKKSYEKRIKTLEHDLAAMTDVLFFSSLPDFLARCFLTRLNRL